MLGTQERGMYTYMSQFIWPNMMPQFSPSLCPTRAIFPNSLNQFFNMQTFPRTESTGTQVLGGHSSLFEFGGQGSGGDRS